MSLRGRARQFHIWLSFLANRLPARTLFLMFQMPFDDQVGRDCCDGPEAVVAAGLVPAADT
jgi:hypothetical protein